MQKPLFDPEYLDELEKNAEKKQLFSDKTKGVFEEHLAFLERKKKFVEERKIWRQKRK